MVKIKQTFKHIAKEIIPPFMWNVAKNVFTDKTFVPRWNVLSYEPMKGVQLYFDPTGLWQKKMLSGSYDKFLFDRLATIDVSGKVIYDIGTHIGFHSLYFAQLVGKEGKVYSFEPNQTNVERCKLILNKNPDLEKRIIIFDIAVSDVIGNDKLNINNDIESGRSSGNFIGGADTFWNKRVYERKGFIKTRVKTVPIDSFKEELGINELPDIMKVDVEGAEYLVLLGAKKTLLSKKPHLFIEIHSILNMYNVVALLNQFSYAVKVINTDTNGICFIEANT